MARTTIATARSHYRSRRLVSRTAEFAATYRGHGDAHAGRARHARALPDRALLPVRGEPSLRSPTGSRFTICRGRCESAEREIAENTMADAAGIRLPRVAPLLHFAKRQDMVCWGPECSRASLRAASAPTIELLGSRRSETP